MKALITGITGQDGSYLAELLLEKGYDVIGIKRRASTQNTQRIDHLDFEVVECEMSDAHSIYSIIEKEHPDELYNLAAQSHVGTSFKQPAYAFHVNTLGVLNCLEGIRQFSPQTKFYQASTSELFGKSFSYDYDTPMRLMIRDGEIVIVDGVGGLYEYKRYQDEDTPFLPQSPYAIAKLAAHNLVRMYREAYDIHASAGILFNHESPRRGEEFVTRKITKWIGKFKQWEKKWCPDHISLVDPDMISGSSIGSSAGVINYKPFPKLRLGNINTYRDWGHARDYVRAMYLMLQQDVPDDYVIATGETHSIKDFLEIAFGCAGIPGDFMDYIVIDPQFYRPAEVEYLCGRADKANEELGWKPVVSFKELVLDMVNSDLSNT